MTRSRGILTMPKRNPMQRFMEKVEKRETGCWVWTAQRDIGGYGKFTTETGAYVQAHRYAYERFRGPIPDGLVLDHLCRVRACVNPDHLEAVTDAENIRRGMSPNVLLHALGQCKRGHVLTAETAYYRSSSLICKVCNAARNKRRYRKNLTIEEIVGTALSVEDIGSRLPRPHHRGETNPFARYTQAEIEKMRAAHRSGESLRSLARRFHTSHSHIGRIVRGEHWPACTLFEARP